MAPTSKINSAPVKLQRELQRLAAKHGFGTISELQTWWNANAPEEHRVSRSGMGTYVRDLKQRLQGFRDQADLMREIKLSFGVDNWAELQDEFLQTTSFLLQQEIAQLLLSDKIKTDEIPLDRLMSAYTRFAQAVTAETERAYKRLQDQRQEEQDKLQKIESEGTKRGLDPETIRVIREEVYGIV